jgi:opacity protein-like surface antigen
MSGFAIRARLLRLACTIGFALVLSGAFAGSASAAKPVEYVKICSLYGAGFFYIPGTDTCIKLGGYLRADATQTGTGRVCDGQYFTPGAICSGRGPTTIDVRECTGLGSVNRAYIQWAGFCPGPVHDTNIFGNSGWVGIEGGFGASFGSLQTLSQITLSGIDVLSPEKSASISGLNGRIGLAGGYDWTMGTTSFNGNPRPWFIGIEGSFDYQFCGSTIRGFPGDQMFTPLGYGTDKIRLERPYEGTVGPRVGVVLQNYMVYVTAGLAVGDFETRIRCGTGLCQQNGIPMFSSSSSSTLVGGYGGIGATTALPFGDGHWRIGGELRITDYGNWNTTVGNPALYQGSYRVDTFQADAMARLNYKFY